MEDDKSYKYFQIALQDWISLKKKNNEAPQKILAIETNSHEGTISKLVNPTRTKPIPFEKQVAFANACGYDYLSFLQHGKKLSEGTTKNIFSYPFTDKDNQKHFEIIKNFKNKPLAIEINHGLVEIESYDLEELEEFNDIVQARRRRLKRKHGQETKKKRKKEN